MLVSAVPPLMLRTEDNPGGLPIEVFDEIRAASIADRSQLYGDLADDPFFGNDRPGANVSQGIRDALWRVSFGVGGQASAALVPGATLKVYAGAPHGITDTHKEQLGADLPAFINTTLERTTHEPEHVHA